jgi:hypothetical protein
MGGLCSEWATWIVILFFPFWLSRLGKCMFCILGESSIGFAHSYFYSFSELHLLYTFMPSCKRKEEGIDRYHNEDSIRYARGNRLSCSLSLPLPLPLLPSPTSSTRSLHNITSGSSTRSTQLSVNDPSLRPFSSLLLPLLVSWSITRLITHEQPVFQIGTLVVRVVGVEVL